MAKEKKKERRTSVISTIASIAKQLSPKKSKSKKDAGSHHHRRHSRDNDASSSSASSSENSRSKSKSPKDSGPRHHRSSSTPSDEGSYSESKHSCSDLSGSEGDRLSAERQSSKVERLSDCSSSGEESSVERHRHHRSRENNRHHKDRKRTSRNDRHSTSRSDRHSFNSHSGRSPPRLINSSNAAVEDDATQMVNLLMGILPFYGRGDSHSDSVVVDTLHKLPSQALEIQDVDGNTLLILACQSSAYDLLPILLSKGCNVNARNKAGATSLHFAVFVDTFSSSAAMKLVRAGAIAEIAELDFGCTPLHWAAFSGDIQLCAALVSTAGANPQTLDKNGCDPIHYARQNGHDDCAQLLESFIKTKIRSSPSASGTHRSSSSENSEWIRCLDSRTGASFYNNQETGESVWGDDFRNVDLQASDTAVVDGGDAKAVEIPKVNADKLPEVHRVRQAPVSRKPDKTPPKASVLTAVEEDLVEVSSNESGKVKVATSRQSPHSASVPRSPKRDSASRSPEKDVLSVNNPHTDMDVAVEPKDAPVNYASSPDPNTLLTLNQTFEERIASLHQKMEMQLTSRLQQLEEKMAQQNIELTTKAVDDSSRMKTNVSEMASTIAKLQLEIGTKELEVLSLRQQVVKLESDKLSKPPSMNANVGDGDVHDSATKAENAELLAANACREKELEDIRTEVCRLKKEIDISTKALSAVTLQCEQAKRSLESAEKMVSDEKSSHAFTKSLLEQAKKGGDADSALSLSLQEGKRIAENTVLQLKEKLRLLENNMLDESSRFANMISTEQSKAAQLTKDLEKKDATLKAFVSELSDRHKRELDQLNEQVKRTSSTLSERHRNELEQMQNQINVANAEMTDAQAKLREANMSKLELMVSKDEAVHKMEQASIKARLAETKLQEMTAFINRTNELKEANDKLHISLSDEVEKRKVLHNTLEDLKGRIRVYVRVRPLSDTEVKANYKSVLYKEGERTCVMEADAATGSDVRDWEFERIFLGSDSDGNTQEAVFKDTSLLITSAIDGFNVCIFAYGQTGSGKTYTMLGSGSDVGQGLAPRLANELFKKLAERESSHHVEVSISILELYLDKLRDLLVDRSDESNETLEDSNLKIHLADHTASGLVEVEGARVERVASAKELLSVFDRGAAGRASSSTRMNAASSRSHMIASIVLLLRNHRTGDVIQGKLTLVDLAGSERVSKSGAAGQELKEAQSINKSLSALGDVISALTSGSSQHVPYRNNPLTMLMSDSIGGNAKTLMFVCCSPADYNRRETANSLDFAKRCHNVTNTISGAGATGGANQIKMLRAELSKIKAKEESGGSTSTVKLPKVRRPGM